MTSVTEQEKSTELVGMIWISRPFCEFLGTGLWWISNRTFALKHALTNNSFFSWNTFNFRDARVNYSKLLYRWKQPMVRSMMRLLWVYLHGKFNYSVEKMHWNVFCILDTSSLHGDFISRYPDPATTTSTLDLQQKSLLRQQQKRLQVFRDTLQATDKENVESYGNSPVSDL